jgi:hypothetical protein
MLHACLCTICFVFCYTSRRFYAFSRTNLVTRCHSVSSLFSAIFVFQKSYTGNIIGIGRNKSRSSYFARHETESKAETEESQGPATPWGGAGQPLAAPPGGGATWPTSWRRPLPIYSPRRENPKTRSIFHETYCKPPPSLKRDQEGLEALPGTLPKMGITTGGLLHHHACLRSDVGVVYLRLRVHSSS